MLFTVCAMFGHRQYLPCDLWRGVLILWHLTECFILRYFTRWFVTCYFTCCSLCDLSHAVYYRKNFMHVWRAGKEVDFSSAKLKMKFKRSEKPLRVPWPLSLRSLPSDAFEAEPQCRSVPVHAKKRTWRCWFAVLFPGKGIMYIPCQEQWTSCQRSCDEG